jgi:hypothetical protein
MLLDSVPASSRSGRKPSLLALINHHQSTTPHCTVRSARNNQRSGSACHGPRPWPRLVQRIGEIWEGRDVDRGQTPAASRPRRRRARSARTGDPAWLWHTRGSGNRVCPRSPWVGWIHPSNNSNTAAPPLYLCMHYCHQAMNQESILD